MTPQYLLYSNGEFKVAANIQEVINPATGEVIAGVASAQETDVEYAVHSARAAFDQGQWPKLSLKERKEFLLKIAQGILDNAGELARLETLNTGKPIKESTFMDIPSSAKAFEYCANHLQEYLVDETITISSEINAGLRREPVGVVVLIVPWNYPLLIASWKMAQSLAAGNTIIVKPSSLTPLSVLELAKIIHACGLPKGAVNIIPGSGESIGKVLCTDKRVDMISFTGSNAVGSEILGYSTGGVKKMIMELGGKSAAIVLKDADLEAAVNGSLCSIFLNQGQMCTAMSRICIEDDIYDAFVSDFTRKAARIKLGNGLDYETQMGPLISEAQREKVLAYVQEALREGAHVLCGGGIPKEPALEKGFFFEATVLENVSPRMNIFRQEVFGPVVSLHKFSGIDEVVALVNDSDFGLAAAVWTKDAVPAQDVAGKINAGTIWVNTYGMFYNEAPYGGFKQSGFGKELGKEGFLEYTRLKNIIVDQTRDSKPLVNYWYGF
jgi:betaine-aldehyde dehydrogenase